MEYDYVSEKTEFIFKLILHTTLADNMFRVRPYEKRTIVWRRTNLRSPAQNSKTCYEDNENTSCQTDLYLRKRLRLFIDCQKNTMILVPKMPFGLYVCKFIEILQRSVTVKLMRVCHSQA